MVESEAVPVTGRLQPQRAVDEKSRVVNEMFLTGFGEKHLGYRLCSRRIQPNVEQRLVSDRLQRTANIACH
jgi:hypothetical protein